MTDDPRIEMLSADIMNSSLLPAEKDLLADDLKWASDINGSSDLAQQGLKRLVIGRVRDRLGTHAHIEREIKSCRSRGHCDQPAAPSDAVNAVVVVSRALAPWRWPFALAVFSPFAADLFTRVVGFFRA